MLVKISKTEWENISSTDGVFKAGQEADGSIIYAIVPDGTTVTGEELQDMPSHIMQEVHPGKFGEYMDLATIENISAIKEIIGEKLFDNCSNIVDLYAIDIDEVATIKANIGDITFNECNTLNELRMADTMVTNSLMIDYLAQLVM